MRKTVFAALLVLAPLPASAMDHMGMQAGSLKWGPAPPGLPPGAQVTVVSGDPSKAEPYVVRAKMPKGYKIGPHTHPTDENVTILSGTFHIAMGDKFDAKAGDKLTAGGFFSAKAGMKHYAWTDTPAVIQIHGMGPFEITYVNPADDPRSKPTAQATPKQ